MLQNHLGHSRSPTLVSDAQSRALQVQAAEPARGPSAREQKSTAQHVEEPGWTLVASRGTAAQKKRAPVHKGATRARAPEQATKAPAPQQATKGPAPQQAPKGPALQVIKFCIRM